MAKIKYSALVSDMRNKLNGSVMSKNRYGSIVRNKVTPVNPQSVSQQLRRASFGSLAASWRGISAAAQATWRAGAINFPFKDIFGDAKVYSGSTLYQKLNGNLMVAGAAVLENCPTPVEMPTLDFTINDVDDTTFKISMAPDAVPAGYALLVYATPGVSPGRIYVKNLFKLVAVNPVMAGGNLDILAQYDAVFGPPQEGQRVAVRMVFVSTTTGQAGVPLEEQAIVG